jgi:uncharacterized protein
MQKIDWLEREIDEISNQKQRPKSVLDKIREIVYTNYFKESPPRIAVIGKAGVGKSSTINSLFNTDLRIGHTRRGTYRTKQLNIKPNGQLMNMGQGEIVVFDMPGLGDDVDIDSKTKTIYRDVLAQSDVAIWVVSAIDRGLAYDQIFLREIIGDVNPDLYSRLIIGVNKLDLVHPDNWNRRINLPSKKQEQNFDKVLRRIEKSFSKVCPDLTSDRIVGYSAVRRYNLTHLFRVMLDACPNERAWLLNERRNIADFTELAKVDVKTILSDFGGESLYGS